MWEVISKVLAAPAIAALIIKFSMRTPYSHLPNNDDPSYMARYWVFNPYDRATNMPRWRFFPWSVRVHHIKRADLERHMHDHPWNARTIILKGAYTEHVKAEGTQRLQILEACTADIPPEKPICEIEAYFVERRTPGHTGTLGFGKYHRIIDVSDGGAWTLFISGPWQGVWGFWVDGAKVAWREYLGLDK